MFKNVLLIHFNQWTIAHPSLKTPGKYFLCYKILSIILTWKKSEMFYYVKYYNLYALKSKYLFFLQLQLEF